MKRKKVGADLRRGVASLFANRTPVEVNGVGDRLIGISSVHLDSTKVCGGMPKFHARPPLGMCPSLHLRTSAAARDAVIAQRSFGYPLNCPMHPSSAHGDTPASAALIRAPPWTLRMLSALVYHLDDLSYPCVTDGLVFCSAGNDG